MKHKKAITIFLSTLLIVVLITLGVTGTIDMSPEPQVRSRRVMSLTDRYPNEAVNDVFRDNILLVLSYLEDRVPTRGEVDWNAVNQPQSYSVSLAPGEVFAFHEDVLPEYQNMTVKPTNAHFNYSDGFKHSGHLMGDGVCHLASVLYWAAVDAGLDTQVPANHDFAVIPGVPREYGVSIYFMPGAPDANAQQNLYVTNTFDEPVEFIIDYDGADLTVQVV